MSIVFVSLALAGGHSARGDGAPPPSPAAATTEAEDAAAGAFVDRCSGCHTIGHGKLKGPDLAAVAGWPGPKVAQNVRRMEKNVGTLTDAQVASLVSLLLDPKAGARVKAEEDRAAKALLAHLAAPSPAKGRALFLGTRGLEHGGMACVSCHQAGGAGGTLGPDLTQVASRLGHPALVSGCKNTPFRVMRAAYAAHPVTAQEAVDLAAFLESVDTGRAVTRPAPPVVPVGLGAAALVLAGLVVVHRGRQGRIRRRRAPRFTEGKP